MVKVGDCMPMTEKEFNGNLFDQLSLLDDIERVAKKADCQPVLDIIEIKRAQINRKLYQKPPLANM